MTRRPHTRAACDGSAARRRALLVLLAPATLALSAAARPIAAQPAPPAAGAGADTLHLRALHADALRRDPRAGQPALQAAATAARLRTLGTERLPQLTPAGEATTQSAVPSLGGALPVAAPASGLRVPAAPRDRWQGRVDAEQLLYDGGSLAGRRAVEQRRLAESQAGVEVALHGVREEVTARFFAALLAQERLAQLDLLAEDLAARLAFVRARVRGGAALAGDSAAVLAELLRVRQRQDEARAERRSAVAVLARLTGRAAAAGTVLVAPAVPPLTGAEREARARPEFATFARRRERLAAEARLADAARRPRVSAFGQAGYGRPGLNFLSADADAFALAGVRVRWPVLDWGAAGREGEVRRLAQQEVDAEESAFAERLARATEDDLAESARLEAALPADEQVVRLREAIEREARRRFEEGVLTAAEYVERRNDVTEARLALGAHRVRLAMVRARYLTTLGLEVP
jgi:outer membrane protein TolC